MKKNEWMTLTKLSNDFISKMNVPKRKEVMLKQSVIDGYKKIIPAIQGPHRTYPVFAVFVLELERQGMPHTPRELCKNYGLSISTTTHWMKAFKQAAPDRYGRRQPHTAEDYIKRFCFQFKLPKDVEERAVKLCRRYERFNQDRYGYDPSIDAQCLLKLLCEKRGITLKGSTFTCCAASIQKREEFFKEIGLI